MEVTFLLPKLSNEELDSLKRLDLESQWYVFNKAPHSWITQTYLKLKASGFSVNLDNKLPQSGIVVFHCKDKKNILKQLPFFDSLYLVSVRGDLKPAIFSDVEIVQNKYFDNDQTIKYITHWSQQGIVKRNASRGNTIKNIAYKGFKKNLHKDFQSSEWETFLQDNELNWFCDSVKFDEGKCTESYNWHNYEDVDLVLAVRPDSYKATMHKPPTKLLNSWIAGTPALLGPESAYRNIKNTDLDYIEITNLDDAKRAIKSFISNPSLFQQYRDNYEVRAEEVKQERILDEWKQLFARITGEDKRNHLIPRKIRFFFKKLIIILSGKYKK